MARGNIYYITKDGNESVSFDESDFYEKLDVIGGDYVKNVTREESQIPLNWLREKMQGLGADIIDMSGSEDFLFGFRFDAVEQMQQDYFRPKLEKLKEEAARLTLFDVVNKAPELDYICNNNCTDVVCVNEGYYTHEVTVDDFIREIMAGVTYYVHHKVILLH